MKQYHGREEGRMKMNDQQEAWPKGIAAPARRALASIGAEGMNDLSRFTEEELTQFHGMGKKGLEVLKEEMKRRGVQFRMSGRHS